MEGQNSQQSIWKCFYTQNGAFQYIEENSSYKLHVFSYQSSSFPPSSGKRLFVVTTLATFWSSNNTTLISMGGTLNCTTLSAYKNGQICGTGVRMVAN